MKGRKAWRQTYKILACMKYEDFISQAYYLANEIIKKLGIRTVVEFNC